MGYRSTRSLVEGLRREGMLVTVDTEVDGFLEIAEIQRRVYLNQGPAVLFESVKDCPYPVASNLFGNLKQAKFLFRDTFERVRRAIELKIDPQAFLRNPTRYWSAPWTAWAMTPKRVGKGAVCENAIRLNDLPKITSWPADGGPFVTLPQVFSQPPLPEQGSHRLTNSNLGMYRIQLAGNEYDRETEVGLHYQIHRGIGVHHRDALDQGKPFPVSVTVGGSPAMTVAAVMPLPEGLSELTFAGALAGHRIPIVSLPGQAAHYADADFCISGFVDPTRTKPEGPFGDHLGYYSLQHEFPYIQVQKISARNDAVWPMTVVGRPPQEDTTFGELIHELTGPIIPTVIPGVSQVHAVDAAGVHPLLLAIGSERYMPFHQSNRPAELLTQAHAILGQGQLSLAKYLIIANGRDEEGLDAEDIPRFLQHVLKRIDWRRDLHFQTETTIDTLDYTGESLNVGSKVIMAANGPPIRELCNRVPSDLHLPNSSSAAVALPGVLCVSAPSLGEPSFENRQASSGWKTDEFVSRLATHLEPQTESLKGLPLLVVTEDAPFMARTINNFLWATFTRSNPATDIDGVGAFVRHKHWGCTGPLIIDARRKPFHAPALIESPDITRRVDALAASGKAISRYL